MTYYMTMHTVVVAMMTMGALVEVVQKERLITIFTAKYNKHIEQ